MRNKNVVRLFAVLASTAQPLVAQLSQPIPDAVLETFTWRSVGPTNMMGRITDVEGIPSPSKTFYVAAAAGGVWKTTNNGTSFKLVWGGDPERSVIAMGDLAISPSDPDIVWAGTGEANSRNSISPGGGIYKSADGGDTWEFKGLGDAQVIARVVVHPTNPDIVYVAALGHIWGPNGERGLYRTKDGGETWELVKFVSDKAGFVEVVIHPHHPERLFATSWERQRGPYFLQSGGPGSALWRSDDGGDTWTEVVGNGFPTSEKGRINLAISQSNPHTMYAMVEARGEGEDDGYAGNGLYRSTDSGETWEKMNDVNTRPFYYSQVRVDPQDEDRVYFSSTPVQVSNDGGKTYGSTTNAVHVDHHAMWIDTNDPQRMVVGNDGGIAVTFDRGGNWIVPNIIALGQFYDVSYNMDVPYRVCGGLQDNGTWCAPSRVAQGQLSKYHWATISGGDGFVSVQDPVDPGIVWSESQGGNMGRSNLATGERTSLTKPDWQDVWTLYQDTIVTLLDEGVSEDDARIADLRQRATADSLANAMRWNWNTPFFQSAHHRSWFYAAGNMVVKSTDWGDDLVPISPDLSYNDSEKVAVATKTTGGITPDVTGAETYATVVALDESPLQVGLLYAGTDDGRLWMTEDDGENWSELTDRLDGVPAGGYISRVKASSHDRDRFYVTVDHHRTNDFTPYVFVTDDGGGSFRSIAGGLPSGGVDFVHVIEEDPHNPNLLFVGTDVGAYVSTDRGDSWQRFMQGMPVVPVHDLEIQPRDRELIAATHGRSIWIVGIAALEGFTDGVISDGGALFEPPPAFQFGQPARGGESSGQMWWARPTPGAEAQISYYIGDELAAAVAEAAEAEGEDEDRPADPPQGRAGGGRRGPGGPGGMRTRGPQVEISITDSNGEAFGSVSGPGSAGLHSVGWNMRGQAPATAEPGPYDKEQQEIIAARMTAVRDSLVEEGWDEQFLDRMAGAFTGQTSRNQLFSMFGPGGGGAGRDPEAFRERPGEQMGGGGGGGYGRMRELANIVMPGASLGQIFRRVGGGRGGNQAPLAEPGVYTLTLKVGDRTFTRSLTVERVGELTGNSSPFEEEWARFLQRTDRVR
jgi:photosystem II stability/assembly factor-like uncharacterized protein